MHVAQHKASVFNMTERYLVSAEVNALIVSPTFLAPLSVSES
jgi:hypothetical protein